MPKMKKSSDYEPCQIVEDEIENNLESNPNSDLKVKLNAKPKKVRIKSVPQVLSRFYYEEPNIIEIGVDEVGRGPLFGRVYSAAVILPKDDSFDHSKMKDSKKFTSKKKIEEVAKYIKEHSLSWNITYEDEKTIDNINILQATQKSMHNSIEGVISKYNKTHTFTENNKFIGLIDGNYFKPYTSFNKTKKMIEKLDHVCVEGGDNKFSAIAAASILAKVERDAYIEEMCKEYPDLSTKYCIDSNKGYGAKKHIEGIKEYGITIWHRRSFGICKEYV
jgi:ribonuclease HII